MFSLSVLQAFGHSDVFLAHSLFYVTWTTRLAGCLCEPTENIYKEDRRQGETKVFLWPIYSLGDVSGSCWHFPTVPAHTWQLRFPPDAPELISLPRCVDLGDPAACFPANLEAVPPSWSAFMSVTLLAVLLVLWIKPFWCSKCWQLCILSRLSLGWFSSWEWQGTSASSYCLICQVRA